MCCVTVKVCKIKVMLRIDSIHAAAIVELKPGLGGWERSIIMLV